MKVTSDLLAARLEARLGPGFVRSSPRILASYVVDGRSPRILCLPNSPEGVSVALRTCAEAEASVIPWGGGTSISLGNIPRQVEVVLGLEGLDGLVEHDDANLTATAQGGMRLSTLQEALGKRNQFLAIDPPQPGHSTLGGLVAANTNGPRRMLYGSVRDLVIGMKMVLVTGKQIKAGGKVVKNVAGYDMCKLFVGSLGTLGIITEVTFKMAPIPESAGTAVAWGPLAQLLQLADELSRSTLLPAAIAVLSADVTKEVSATLGGPAVAVWAEGFEEAVDRHLHDVEEMAKRVGLTSQTLRDEAHQRLWGHVRDLRAHGNNVLYRLTVSLASVARVLSTIDQWSVSGRPVRTIAHIGSGTLWVLLDGDPSSAAWFPKLTALAQEHRGHAVMAGAPPALKEGVDVWGPSPPGLAILREIKRQFDPQGILNPGRFIARL